VGVPQLEQKREIAEISLPQEAHTGMDFFPLQSTASEQMLCNVVTIEREAED